MSQLLGPGINSSHAIEKFYAAFTVEYQFGKVCFCVPIYNNDRSVQVKNLQTLGKVVPPNSNIIAGLKLK